VTFNDMLAQFKSIYYYVKYVIDRIVT